MGQWLFAKSTVHTGNILKVSYLDPCFSSLNNFKWKPCNVKRFICFTVCQKYNYSAIFISYCRHLSSVLGNKFDHGAEAIMPTIFNLIPNSAKIMATSGVVAVRLIIRVSIFWGRT